MKTLRNLFLGTTIGALLSLGTALASDDAVTAWYNQPSLDGTWQFEMTVRFDAPDCTTSDPIPFGPNPFPGLISYHEGGTLNEFASRASPAIRSTGFGSWKQTGAKRFKARYTFMEFDASGLLWRNMVVNSEVTLGNKGNKYTAINRLELTDVSGNVVKICGTVDAVRFKP